jgi:non-canonical purine NTP pyrophosphatase (RdgB/HAM1 family)
MKIILASTNIHKLEEIRKITEKYDIDLVTLDDVGLGTIEIEEDGLTFEENALIKARAVAKLTGEACLADDSGLMVDYLGGAPGVHSARYSGEERNYDANNKKLMRELEGVSGDKRGARFVTVIALSLQDGREMTFRGEVEGMVGTEEKGSNGFGYDPLFIVDGFGQTFAEMASDVKNSLSHRARALERFNEWLSTDGSVCLASGRASDEGR